jgi:hypothetical protein
MKLYMGNDDNTNVSPFRGTRLADWASRSLGRQYGVELLAAVIPLISLLVTNELQVTRFSGSKSKYCSA